MVLLFLDWGDVMIKLIVKVVGMGIIWVCYVGFEYLVFVDV